MPSFDINKPFTKGCYFMENNNIWYVLDSCTSQNNMFATRVENNLFLTYFKMSSTKTFIFSC